MEGHDNLHTGRDERGEFNKSVSEFMGQWRDMTTYTREAMSVGGLGRGNLQKGNMSVGGRDNLQKGHMSVGGREG